MRSFPYYLYLFQLEGKEPFIKPWPILEGHVILPMPHVPKKTRKVCKVHGEGDYRTYEDVGTVRQFVHTSVKDEAYG